VGKLIEQPICYRDQRTRGDGPRFCALPAAEIFARTGIQFLSFNTLFQLYVHAQTGNLKFSERLLLIPDLINFFLTGKAVY